MPLPSALLPCWHAISVVLFWIREMFGRDCYHWCEGGGVPVWLDMTGTTSSVLSHGCGELIADCDALLMPFDQPLSLLEPTCWQRQPHQHAPKQPHSLGAQRGWVAVWVTVPGRKGLAGLRFELGGEDLTGADARLTQAAIESRLAVGLLARACFHGQADITALLEAGCRFSLETNPLLWLPALRLHLCPQSGNADVPGLPDVQPPQDADMVPHKGQSSKRVLLYECMEFDACMR